VLLPNQVERGEHPHLLLVELVEGSIRVVMETGSEKAELTQRLAGKTVQLHIGKDGIALSQPPSVFTEDSVVRGGYCHPRLCIALYLEIYLLNFLKTYVLCLIL